MISVCMATYNGERYIKRQLTSILSQLNDKDEVIISDDGSTDNTIGIIRAMNDKRLLLSLNGGRSGPVGNFEQTLMRATGDFIFLADQDDVWLPDKVSSVLPLLKEYDLVLTDCAIVDKHDKLLKASFFEFRKSRSGFWRNIYKNSYMGCCMAFRKEILSYVLPFPTYIHMHDWWIGLLVEVKGSVFFYNRPLINYVRHDDNVSPTGEHGYGITERIKNRYYLFANVLWRSLHKGRNRS